MTQAPRRIHTLLEDWAARTPDAPFLLQPQASLSFGALQAMVDTAAAELRAAGVRAGDRVLLVCENCPAHVALILACSAVGAWSCGVNARMAPGEIAAFAEKADARLVYFSSGVSSAAAEHADRYQATASALTGMRHSAPRAQAQAETGAVAEQVAALMFTSGTSGTPKGVMATHRALLHFAQVSAASRSLSAQDRVYAFLPMTHAFGLITMLLASLHAGAALVMRSRFEPGDLLDALEHEDIATLLGPPTMFSRLLAHMRETGRRPAAPSLRYLYTGSAPLDLSLKQQVEQVFGLPLHHGYGLSEYAGSLFLTEQQRPRADTAAGHLVPGAEARIVDAQGMDVADEVTGELWIRGVGLMPGYFRDPQATAQALRAGGWYQTGDLARRGADGAVTIVGRLKDMIIRSGFNVYPMEVETAINGFPGVQQSAVVGLAEADGNEQIVAFIELQAAASWDEAALGRHLAERLAAYKRPARCIVLPALPTTSNGKLLKRALIETLHATSTQPA